MSRVDRNFWLAWVVLVILLVTVIAVTALHAENIDAQNAAMYELAMFAEENNLNWYAWQETVGKPWTVEYSRVRKSDGARLEWKVDKCDALTDAVIRLEDAFVGHQEENFSDQCPANQ